MPTRPTNPQNRVNAVPVESPAKKLRQERATLGSRQGDPESPSSGTMYARRKKLSAELEQIQSEQTSWNSGSGRHAQTESVSAPPHRPLYAVQRELRILDEEITATQNRIDEIDEILSTVEGKGRHS
jgi:uncharacterized protein (DUF3084 family)